jgi:AraC-like DNA-binding protein
MVSRLLNASNYLELNIKESGREHCIAEKNFSFTPKTYFLFHYVTSGKGTFTYGDEIYHLHAGDMFYIAPGDKPHYTPDPNDPWTYIWLGFDGSNARAFLDAASISPEHPVFHDEDRRLRPFFDNIYDEYILKGFFDLYCLGEAYGLMGTLCIGFEHALQPVSVAEAHIKAAKEFILNNYQFHITIDLVSKNIGITPNYLANIFEQYEKKSPKRFLIETRMQAAKMLLCSGSYRIHEVAEKVGYSNQLHFSNEFKRFYGKSPINYMKSKGEGDVI